MVMCRMPRGKSGFRGATVLPWHRATRCLVSPSQRPEAGGSHAVRFPYGPGKPCRIWSADQVGGAQSRACDDEPQHPDYPPFDGCAVRRSNAGKAEGRSLAERQKKTSPMSVIRCNPEDICSGRVFRILTHRSPQGSKRTAAFTQNASQLVSQLSVAKIGTDAKT